MRAACLTRLFCRKLFPSGALHCEPSAAIQRELLTCGVSVQEGNLVQLHNAGLSAEVAEERGSGGGAGWGGDKRAPERGECCSAGRSVSGEAALMEN